MTSATESPIPPPPAAAPSEPVSSRVRLLPDGRFFVRAIPVTPEGPANAVAAQVELALETLAPFPLAQLYHGHYWTPGSPRALVYAAYRRRFTTADVDEWMESELVVPAFMSAVGVPRSDGVRFLILIGTEGVTGIQWAEEGPVPTRVVSVGLSIEASEEERRRGVEDVRRELGAAGDVPEVAVGPGRSSGMGDGDFEFGEEENRSSLPLAQADMLDIRDKEDLAARRRSRNRDLWLWRGLVGLAALIALCLVGEGARLGLNAWQKQRVALQAAQQPDVDTVIKAQTITTRIEKLTNDRLHPFEMLEIADTLRPRNPGARPTIQFLRATTSGYDKLVISAKTSVAGDLTLFEAALRKSPSIADVTQPVLETRAGETRFEISIQFKLEALRSAANHPRP